MRRKCCPAAMFAGSGEWARATPYLSAGGKPDWPRNFRLVLRKYPVPLSRSASRAQASVLIALPTREMPSPCLSETKTRSWPCGMESRRFGGSVFRRGAAWILDRYPRRPIDPHLRLIVTAEAFGRRSHNGPQTCAPLNKWDMWLTVLAFR